MDVMIDTETTSLYADDGGIISVGIAWRHPKTKKILTKEWECNPGEKYWKNGRAAKALAVNGYTEKQIAKLPSVEEIAPKVIQFLKEMHDKYGIVLHAYNLGFDQPFLDCNPWNMEPEFEWGPCVMLAAKDMWDPYGKWFKLIEAFGCVEPCPPNSKELLYDAHNASADCIMTLHVWECIQKTRIAYCRSDSVMVESGE